MLLLQVKGLEHEDEFLSGDWTRTELCYPKLTSFFFSLILQFIVAIKRTVISHTVFKTCNWTRD
uniref:Uncharacterized protein n=1 Tax=Monopterus albus TaxID=43700 RepID=A0A3Q3KBH6_MONAL